jgi:4-oxalmesaconate hydratase
LPFNEEQLMIIDSHGHISNSAPVYTWHSGLVSGRATAPALIEPPVLSDADQGAVVQRHLKVLDGMGTDVQLISPRPFAMLHSMQPGKVSRVWNTWVNDLIAQHCRLSGGRLFGVGGLPQHRNDDPAEALDELDRCINQLGFVGILLNPDPMEGDSPAPPGLGDRFWYPVYEKLVELDIPALIHAASCSSPRESYTLHFVSEESIGIISLIESDVFKDFPTLRVIFPHGGGAIPYQAGRFQAWRSRDPGSTPFIDSLRQLYFDTCNYSKDALALLFKLVGSDRCLYGTEAPGTGSVPNPQTGRPYDDLMPQIKGIPDLGAADLEAIFEHNVRSVYPRLDKALTAAGR